MLKTAAIAFRICSTGLGGHLQYPAGDYPQPSCQSLSRIRFRAVSSDIVGFMHEGSGFLFARNGSVLL